MDDLFNIFGSRGAVQLTSIDHNVHQAVPCAKGLLSSKSNIAGGTLPKGKKVLCDVGNKIKGLNNKSNNNGNDILKKPLQVNKAIAKNSGGSQGAKPKNKLNEILENQKLSAQIPLPDTCDEETEWPEVETQGSSFWNDEKCSDLLWPESEWPTLEDFSKTCNIWDNEDKRSCSLTPSPPPSEFHDDLQFCFDLPKSPNLLLDEVTVPFPWEL